MHTVTVGEAVTIELPATPTTGYQWHLSSPALELIDSGFIPAGRAPGQGGVQWFTFRTHTAGRFRMVFELGRVWENDPIDSRTVTVEVHPAS